MLTLQAAGSSFGEDPNAQNITLHAGATAGGPGSAAAGARKPAAAAAAEDDDIFGDAGTDYKPAIKKKEAKGQQAEDMELEEGEAPPGPAPPPAGMDAAQAAALAYGAYPDTYGQYGDAYGAGQYGAGQYGVDPYGGQYAGVWPDAGAAAAAYGAQGAQQQAAAVDEPKWRVRPKKAEERMVDFVDDAYGEYYPMAVSALVCDFGGFSGWSTSYELIPKQVGCISAASFVAAVPPSAACCGNICRPL